MVEVYSGINVNDLKNLLKNEIKEITLKDLYDLSLFFNEEKAYLPPEYKKKYTESVLNVTINRFTLLKNDNNLYEGILKDDDVKIINKLLQSNDNIITHILNIIVINWFQQIHLFKIFPSLTFTPLGASSPKYTLKDELKTSI